jgi:hypothetical protein
MRVARLPQTLQDRVAAFLGPRDIDRLPQGATAAALWAAALRSWGLDPEHHRAAVAGTEDIARTAVRAWWRAATSAEQTPRRAAAAAAADWCVRRHCDPLRNPDLYGALQSPWHQRRRIPSIDVPLASGGARTKKGWEPGQPRNHNFFRPDAYLELQVGGTGGASRALFSSVLMRPHAAATLRDVYVYVRTAVRDGVRRHATTEVRLSFGDAGAVPVPFDGERVCALMRLPGRVEPDRVTWTVVGSATRGGGRRRTVAQLVARLLLLWGDHITVELDRLARDAIEPAPAAAIGWMWLASVRAVVGGAPTLAAVTTGEQCRWLENAHGPRLGALDVAL